MPKARFRPTACPGLAPGRLGGCGPSRGRGCSGPSGEQLGEGSRLGATGRQLALEHAHQHEVGFSPIIGDVVGWSAWRSLRACVTTASSAQLGRADAGPALGDRLCLALGDRLDATV